MIGSVPEISQTRFLMVRIAASIRRILLKLIVQAKRHAFRRYEIRTVFLRNYLPQLYRRHIKKNTRNCLFLFQFVKSECHRYCFKCSAGTYKVQSSTARPLYASSVQMEEVDALPVPAFQNLFRLQKASRTGIGAIFIPFSLP